MLKSRVENLEIKNWNYERYAFQSGVLNQEFHCGFFRPNSKTKIDKTFYILHGGGADDSQPIQVGLLPVFAEMLNLRSHDNIQFVFPYVGNSFLHDHPTLKSKSFSHYFLKELVPVCEVQGLIRAENRFICGWSMGGQAALNMFMRSPEHFGGVGVHFPTLVGFDYNDKNQCEAYALRQKVSEPMMNILVTEFQKEFVDLKDFSNHDPLSLAKSQPAAAWKEKKIYFDVGGDDEFGLSEGVEALHEIFQQKKVVHQFELVPQGKHDGPFIHAQISKMLHYLL